MSSVSSLEYSLFSIVTSFFPLIHKPPSNKDLCDYIILYFIFKFVPVAGLVPWEVGSMMIGTMSLYFTAVSAAIRTMPGTPLMCNKYTFKEEIH